MSYGSSASEQFRLTGAYTGRILEPAPPRQVVRSWSDLLRQAVFASFPAHTAPGQGVAFQAPGHGGCFTS
jgi:hypothetical protein